MEGEADGLLRASSKGILFNKRCVPYENDGKKENDEKKEENEVEKEEKKLLLNGFMIWIRCSNMNSNKHCSINRE